MKGVKRFLENAEWLKEQTVDLTVLAGIPVVKLQRFALGARGLNASRMKEAQRDKRYAFAVALIQRQRARTLDERDPDEGYGWRLEMAAKKVSKSEFKAVSVLLDEEGVIPFDSLHLAPIVDTDENGSTIRIQKTRDALQDRVNNLGITGSGFHVEPEALLEFNTGILSLRNEATERGVVVLKFDCHGDEALKEY